MFDKIKTFVKANKQPIVFYSFIVLGTGVSLAIADALGSSIDKKDFMAAVNGETDSFIDYNEETVEED